MGVVLGIDVSTTATKAIVIDDAGRVVGMASSEYPFEQPHPLWSEQHPQLWWDGTVEAIAGALSAAGVTGDDVAAVGLTGQMHGLVLLDADGDVIRPAILWNDQRTAAECDAIRAALGPEHLVEITGNDALTGFTAPKLLWVRDHEPDAWARVAHVLLPKDYVRYRLTGVFALDKADGAGTILFDLAARDWSGEVLDALGIDPAWMPPTHEGPEVTGTVTPSAAAATGLRPGTPVVAGGGDQAANAVGVGAVVPGRVALSLGTSGVVFATTDRPIFDAAGRVHAFCHAVPGRWHLMSVMLSAAGSLRWFRDAIAPGEPFDRLAAAAGSVPAASDGLLFLPYLTGERCPYPDPLARGAFVGLTLAHDMRHMTRAVLEGVAFGLRDGLDLMVGAGMPVPAQVRASGGGTASPLWCQILADVLEADIVLPATTEGAAYGAALLAAVGSGWFASVEEAADAVVLTTLAASPGQDVPRYAEAHARYRSLYPALAPVFHRA
ncbi:MAG: xylulokinase [Chloroflexota bacterium]|nr:xylulokinase [Chloroflexota bacterium]